MDSSPDFYKTAFADWGALPMRRRRQVISAVVKYLLRAAGNPIPYGFFAGVAVGSIDAFRPAKLDIQAERKNLSYLSIETARLLELAHLPSQEASSRVYTTNETLHVIGETAYYVESHRIDSNYVEHSLSKLPASSYLRTLMNFCEDQVHPLGEIRSALLQTHCRLDAKSADAWLSEAIASQVLIERMRLTPLLLDAVRIAPYSKSNLCTAIPASLAEIGGALRRMQSADADQLAVERRFLVDSMREAFDIPAQEVSFHSVQSLEADDANIPPAVLRDIPAAAEALRRVQANPDNGGVISQFCEQFRARFGETYVPLLEAINEECGVALEGRGSDLDEPLLTGHREKPRQPASRAYDARGPHLIHLVEQLRIKNKRVLKLTEDVIRELEVAESKPLPPAFSANLVLGKELNRNRYEIYLKYINGPSGLNTASRFCRQSPQLTNVARLWAEAEDKVFNGAVVAEITHFTGTRADDVLVRPLLHRFNIDCGGSGDDAWPSRVTISLSDLMIGLAGDEVVLWSRRLNARVIPRATSAYNYVGQKNHPVYRFLCCLQDYPYSSRLRWQWGVAENYVVLPRVMYKSVAVSRARWRVTEQLLTRTKGRVTVSCLQRLLHDRMDAPRRLIHVIGDQEFVVDLASVLTCRMLIEHVRKRGYAVLEEAWPQPEDLPVRDSGRGRYAHDLVIPFRRQFEEIKPAPAASYPPPIGPHVVNRRTVQETPVRGFIPGSHWLYYELYSAVSQTDQVLLEVGRAVGGRKFRTMMDQWFFVRYNYPAPHLRLRLRLKKPYLGVLAAQFMLRPLMTQLATRRLVWRVALNTYVPEVQRYGGSSAIAMAEEWFFRDSITQLNVIATLNASNRLDDRWKLAVYETHRLLDDFDMAVDERVAFLRGLVASIAGPKAEDLTYRRWLGERFAKTRDVLAPLILAGGAVEELAAGLSAHVSARSCATSRIVADLSSLGGRHALSVPMESIIGSFIHMQNNRLLRSAQRAQEVVVYELLARLYLMKQRRR